MQKRTPSGAAGSSTISRSRKTATRIAPLTATAARADSRRGSSARGRVLLLGPWVTGILTVALPGGATSKPAPGGHLMTQGVSTGRGGAVAGVGSRVMLERARPAGPASEPRAREVAAVRAEAAPVLVLQRTVGNRATTALLARQPAVADAPALTAGQVARARTFYRSQPDRYTPAILDQIAAAVGAEPAGTVTDELILGVARFQAGPRGQGSDIPANRLKVDGMAGPRTLPVLFPTGLAGTEAMDEYTRDVVAFSGAMRDHDEERRRRLLAVAIGRRLRRLGIPEPAVVLGDENSFDAREWVITYRRSGIRRIDADDPDDLRLLLVGTYHEVRHCEQSFRIAQLLAGEGRTAAQIASIMDLNPRREPGHRTERVVAAALASPLTPGGMDALVARGWFDSEYGAGSAHRTQVLNDRSQSPWAYAQYRDLPEEFDAFHVADVLGDRFQGNPRGRSAPDRRR